MRIREATSDDLPQIVGLLADDQLGRQREEVADRLPDVYRGAFEVIDGAPDNVLVVVEDGGAVVATLQLTFIPYLTHRGSWRAQVEGVRVASHRRGEGIGRRLMEWAVREARERDCRLIQLTSDRRRTDAHRFYRSLGFEPTHHGFKRDLREGRGV